MAEFFNVLPPDEARALLFSHLTQRLPAESISTAAALGRVTAEPLYAPHPLPAFRRSTMDGFAVRAVDTYGASATLPAFLTVVGEVRMGVAADVVIKVGQAALVHTGGMIPETADAVVQVEWTQLMGRDEQFPYEIEVLKAVADGQNVLQVGEDVRQGEQILPAGHLIRPQDLGGILALGITEVAVSRRPRVAVMATGDEVVEPSETAEPGQIRDINSYTVAGQIRQAGGIPVLQGIVPDELGALKTAAEAALAENDMLIMSAGSSVSVRDMTVQVIDSLGQPGVLFHGVATRPGKPTIVGVIGGKLVLGLPGNPVSAMIQFEMFGVPAVWRVQGLHSAPRRGIVTAKVSQNISSESGREDYVPARLEETAEGLIAIPVFGKSNLIYTLINADGILKVPINKSGLEVGEFVEVGLF